MSISRFLEKSSASFDFRLARASDLLRRNENAGPPPLPTRIDALDRMAGGGLERGSLVQLVGGRSSGSLSVGLSILAAATDGGETAAFIDIGDQLDPRAAEEAGVDLGRLLWVRPRRVKDAIASAEMILNAGFSLVVIDTATRVLSRREAPDAAWLRLARAAKEHSAVCVAIVPTHVPTPTAHAILRVDGARPKWNFSATAAAASEEAGSSENPSTPLLAGFGVNVSINRRKSESDEPMKAVGLGMKWIAQ